jgi:hypothetical protein
MALAAGVWPRSQACGQARPEVIRGRVTTDSGRVIAGADVIVTMAPNRDVFRSTSDSAGQYRVEIAKGTGDYLVYIGAPGRRALRKRVTRSGNDSVYVVDASLPRDVTTVAAVRTTAQRTRVPRSDDAPMTVGSMTTQYAGVNGALSPDQMGDLAAMAATVPGIAVTPDGGISVFGLDAGQNRYTMSGLTFDGASVPRDLRTRVRVSSSAYDPTIGGFGGAIISVDIIPGGALTQGQGHLSLDAPQLQAADATARELGGTYTRFQGGYGRTGELSQDRWVYSASIEGTRRTADAPSIVTAEQSALQHYGVASDSATRFLNLLAGRGIPTRVAGLGDGVLSTSVNGAVRLDRAAPSSYGTQIDTKPHLALIALSAYNRTDPATAIALAPPARGQVVNSGHGTVQAILSQYLGADAAYLSETKTALSYNASQLLPLTPLPSGNVLVTSALPDGSSGVAQLQFGGSPSRADTRSWRWESSNEVSFTPLNHPSHRLKVFTQAQLDGYHQVSEGNSLGTFSYNSLADLEANTPASFTRTLFTPEHRGGEASGAFAVADFWTKSPELQFVFGPRVEWSTFLRTPQENPEIARVFGANTDFAPGGVHVSPRFGFNWLYGGRRPFGTVSSSMGTTFTPPKGVLRGGFGEFRNPYPSTLLSNAGVATGLPGETTRRLTCTGPAVPMASWADMISHASSLPSTCADGTASVFADSAPAVELFDRSFQAARRWTGNLDWSSALKAMYYTISVSQSFNLEQPGFVDLNFSGVPRFSLPSENGRPVFVNPGSIDPVTGLVSPVDARSSSEFGRVLGYRSDLRSEVTQATLIVVPWVPQRLGRWMVNGSYTYAASRSLTRGFDNSTFGDPSIREWSSGSIPHHQIRTQLGYLLRPFNSTLTTYWSFQSGYSYTPIVSGDINGDGLANDRAFVFDPASAPSAVASQMRTLLASTTSEARDCLASQLGAVAARNSCRNPWTATMNARLTWNRRFGDFYHYVQGSINFFNPLGGLDELLHGGSHLRGWGTPATPDPKLVYVRGFDPATKQFLYEVNPRFGNTRPSLGAYVNPFRVTVDFTFSLTGNAQMQQLNIYLRPTRSAPGQRPPADTILKRLRSTGVSPASPYGWILANSDSLLLSPEQANALNADAARYYARIDSTYHGFAAELAGLPADYNPDVALQRMNQFNNTLYDSSPEGIVIRGVLTPIQLRLLPPPLVSMLTPRPPAPRP